MSLMKRAGLSPLFRFLTWRSMQAQWHDLKSSKGSYCLRAIKYFESRLRQSPKNSFNDPVLSEAST